jgi:hypothetical protein
MTILETGKGAQLGVIPVVHDCGQSTEGKWMRTDSGTTKGNGWKEVDEGGFNGNRRVDLQIKFVDWVRWTFTGRPEC